MLLLLLLLLFGVENEAHHEDGEAPPPPPPPPFGQAGSSTAGPSGAPRECSSSSYLFATKASPQPQPQPQSQPAAVAALTHSLARHATPRTTNRTHATPRHAMHTPIARTPRHAHTTNRTHATPRHAMHTPIARHATPCTHHQSHARHATPRHAPPVLAVVRVAQLVREGGAGGQGQGQAEPHVWVVPARTYNKARPKRTFGWCLHAHTIERNVQRTFP